MDPKHPDSDRPNTLGQAWRRMNNPRVRKVADLPPLPNWPPLPEERYRVDWPELSTEPVTPVEPVSADAGQQMSSDAPAQAAQPWPVVGALRTDTGILGRWRRASKRMRFGIAGAALAFVLLIAGCSSLALHVVSGMGDNAAAPLFSGSPSQQATGGSTSSSLTATPGAARTPTSAPTPAMSPTATVPLTLAITCASGSVRGTGSVCVHTAPSAALTIAVRYCDGTYAKGLRSSAVADASGAYTWSWPIHMACVGTATATVTAKYNGASMTTTQTFDIKA